MTNLLWDLEMSLLNKEWKNGINKYEQANCTCTLTDKGYRIYRPPNIPAEDHNMWGGLRFHYPSATETYLEEGHTYIILFDVEGQTSNRVIGFWASNMGWENGSSGIMPNPTYMSRNDIPVNFQGKKTYFYKWTINDKLYKVCKNAYSTFVKGETYLSYREFTFGFNYENTGSLGTDIYLSNFRMYDLTNEQVEAVINANGDVIFTSYNETIAPPSVSLSGEICVSDIWEI